MPGVAPHGHWSGEGPDCCTDRLVDLAQSPSRENTQWSRTRTMGATRRDKEHLMLDILMLAIGFGLFVVAVGYTYACERL